MDDLQLLWKFIAFTIKQVEVLLFNLHGVSLDLSIDGKSFVVWVYLQYIDFD